jgi:hypothetical protein
VIDAGCIAFLPERCCRLGTGTLSVVYADVMSRVSVVLKSLSGGGLTRTGAYQGQVLPLDDWLDGLEGTEPEEIRASGAVSIWARRWDSGGLCSLQQKLRAGASAASQNVIRGLVSVQAAEPLTS